jgi:phosphate transport system substrate-binding protein
MTKTFAMTALVLGMTAAAGAQAQQITGAGATFPAPVYTKWGEAAKAAIGLELNYQAIGSGGGQNQILQRTVDFGASDAPMAADKLDSGKLLQFPTVMGAVAIIVNIPGVEMNQLKISGELLADIYEGKITKWNDPKIVEMNKGVTLPNLAIAPVYRADGSGTSFVYTSYLSAVSKDWKEKVGAATSVKWPAGAGAKGNDGVAATVHNTRGGIGFVEYAFASQNKLTTVQLRNKAGQFVKPEMASFAAAAIFDDPQHPYTLGLLGSIPRIETVSDRLLTIEGTVPPPFDPPPGCRFNPRCVFADAACTAEIPPLRSLGPDHTVACLRAPVEAI